MRSVCVFCGSKEGNDQQIIAQTLLLGQSLVQRDLTLVYGGARIGLMGQLAAEVLSAKGKAIGVIPGFLKTKELVHQGLTELVETENMHQRKLVMQQRSDAFMALPGGMGTMEELCEIITWLQLGLHNKPVGILNLNGFYDPLLQLMEQMVRRGFMSMTNYELILVDSDVDRLLDKMSEFRAPQRPKWLNEQRS
ncbi:TIGR00730 family Rossman fold protein [Aureitalea marina]|uniref:Cytokinin riboside 5'-monophosphate phosphoribohydrolase n=1 Tax=Aureitalea marina TaxID=930804 RepID=A0A2S7KN42_9FLAO|nr:TIGR00730 family Rossman fold protein [Aureitalea marina]PQB04018.1 Rossman fold protein, TIGR00730 family [Aureitalea marina]